MSKRMMRVSSFSILLGVVTALLQTILLYFLEGAWYILPAMAVIDLVFSQYLLENSFSFSLCLRYLLTVELLTLAVAVPAFSGMFGTFLPFMPCMYGLVAVHLFIPAIFATIRYLADYGPRFMNYPAFFIGFSVVLWICLIAIFVSQQVFGGSAIPGSQEKVNLIPFFTIAAHIEAKIQDGASLKPLLLYALSYTALFLPAGFYLHLAFRRLFVLRYLCFLLIPAGIEVAQYFLSPAQCDTDDLILAFLGCLIGSALFGLLNRICQSLHEEDFPKKPERTPLYL